MLPRSSISSSAPRPPLASACHHSNCDHGEGCSPWHRDVSAGDQLFTKVDQDHDDLIIVVMGLTGAGKSTFINQFLGEEVMDVGHGLKSCTEKVKSTTTMLPENHKTWPNRRLVLVDTPGFDDTKQSEFQILQNVATWLASVYDNDTKITGLVYLYNIGNPRLGGAALLSHNVFHHICGPDAYSRVVMATTHWGATPLKLAQARVKELETGFWAETLESGAIHMPIQTPESDIKDVIEHILQNQIAVTTRVQKELVDWHLRVEQTGAGQQVISTYHKRLTVSATPRPLTPANAPPLKTTSSPKNSNYILDIMPQDRLFTDAHPDDLIIVVMGMAGAGKSTFINRFCGEELMKVNHGLRSCTKEIGVATLILPSTHRVFPNRRLVLVDTPGFDDTHEGEYETLRRISVWLASVYENNMQVKVAGLVYLHNIAQNRMGRTSLLGNDLFRRICGPAALGRVVMASTHWEVLVHNPAAGSIYENDLKEFLTESLSQGAVYQRIDATDPRRDIGEIIDYILGKNAVAIQVQEELVDLGKRVAETEAAQKLREALESWLEDPQVHDLSEEKEAKLKELRVDGGFVDWVKGLFRLKSR